MWADLIQRARASGPASVIGLTGIAMPGLRRAVATLSGAHQGDQEDLETEVLAGFLAAMRGLDPDDLDQMPLASRLCWAAFRAGQALVYADADLADVAPGSPSTSVSARRAPGAARLGRGGDACAQHRRSR